MENKEEITENLEKMITCRIIQEDAETVFSLMQTEHNPIFALEIIPYYSLFVQACQEYMGETFVDKSFSTKIIDIRNFIKIYGEGFGKSKKRMELIDEKQDENYKSQLRFDFMKNWNIHFNMGTYWTSDKHIVGNTQMLADFLQIDDMFDSKNGQQQYDLGVQIGSFVASIKEGFSKVISPPTVDRLQQGIDIGYYYDLNTNEKNELFVDNSSKVLNLYYLNLTCNMNFMKYILRPLFREDNIWVFRVEYIVTYYTCRAIQRLKNYCENNTDLHVDLDEFAEVLDLASVLFQTKLRNCMMHYGLENRGVISTENIEKPFYGIIETCCNGKDYYSFVNDLRRVADRLIVILEEKLNTEKIALQRLKIQ